jgi:hypothetical protein
LSHPAAVEWVAVSASASPIIRTVSLADLLDAAGEVERALRDMVVSAFQDVAAGAQGLRYTHVGAWALRVAFGNKERLGEVILKLARAFGEQRAADACGQISHVPQCCAEHATHLRRQCPVRLVHRCVFQQP